MVIFVVQCRSRCRGRERRGERGGPGGTGTIRSRAARTSAPEPGTAADTAPGTTRRKRHTTAIISPSGSCVSSPAHKKNRFCSINIVMIVFKYGCFPAGKEDGNPDFRTTPACSGTPCRTSAYAGPGERAHADPRLGKQVFFVPVRTGQAQP